MATYLALQAISLSSEGRYIQPGELFTTDITPGLAWDPQDDDAKAAVAARDAAKEAKDAGGGAQDTNPKGRKAKGGAATKPADDGGAGVGSGDPGAGAGAGDGGAGNPNPPA